MKRLTFLALVVAAAFTSAPHAQQAASTDAVDVALKPTAHPRLPADSTQLWMVPVRKASPNEFSAAVKLEVDGDFARALPILSTPSVQQGALAHYAEYYKGLAELRLARAADARRTFEALAEHKPAGYLVEATALREAESDEALGESSAALNIYERLAKEKTTAPDDVLMRLAKAAKAAGDREKAAEAYSRVVYEFPFSDLAVTASAELETLPVAPITPGSTRYKLELGRAERLFGARRYPQARTSFEAVRSASDGDDREVINLRLAECDYYMKRPRQALEGVRPYIENASRQGEALFFYALAARELGQQDEYTRTVRRLANEFPTQTWAEEALNNLATQYIVQSDDEHADEVFREMYEKFPMGHYAERAAWKIGWWAYKNGRYADTARTFESAAVNFPRSDYRPPWLYWTGRAHEALKESALAEARYTLVATDYLNSYYGRLAVKRLGGRAPQRRLIADTQTVTPAPPGPADDAPPIAPPPPNEHVIRALLALDLYDQAIDELHYAQKVWGDSSVIQATLAWIWNQRGDLRAGITAMKRAYPQYLAAGGEQLPPELLKVLFPVNYWPLIKRYASERDLDPYVIAALIAQESSFTVDVRSAANAYGLMQLLPSTGRQYARILRIPRRFSITMLTTADTNVRMGTAYFADLVRQFGAVHYALATYNAGPNRVARWISERPGVDRDEFIDDIPFPETQNYVKRILGTAEDYRRLYGGDAVAPADEATPAVSHDKTPQAKKASATPAAKKPSAQSSKKKSAASRKTRKAA